jgi:hypothetical protein
MFNAFVTPAPGWRPPRSTPAPQPPPVGEKARPRQRDWEDAAFEEDWTWAVLRFLRQRRREAVPYWDVVNAVAHASIQPARWEVRFATKQVLQAVKALVRDRRVLRYRRRYLAILDLGAEIVPLESYRTFRNGIATGRFPGDSTTQGESVKTAQDRH